ncbi:hypothetical protein SEA_LYMARA_74 [Arthrobacter phage Lymara]|uniref:Uncharacterized protein n=1 Tax=Arthrobacter phage Lymara TaxID=2599828 RepID=A0A5J6TVN5_9CAUD|nr:hypothetical protein HYQ01_gp074 [Arthrobacter phage Lymara]QFG14875.1 hypothetical protein SEA_LYMARA_74 [Arthrobacter phage Lymara]
MNCIGLAEHFLPDAPKGSFYTCPHGRIHRLKRNGWKPVRNPILLRRVKQEQWRAMSAELIALCERVAARAIAKEAEEAERLERMEANREHNAKERAKARDHANRIRWGTDAEAGDAVKLEPEGFEVTRVLGRTKHDAKAGDVVELDMENPPNADFRKDPEYAEALKDWKDREGGDWVPVANREDYTPKFMDPSVPREEHKRRLMRLFDGERKGKGHSEAADFTVDYYAAATNMSKNGVYDMFIEAWNDRCKETGDTPRVALVTADGRDKTEDEIREEAAKLNLEVAFDVSAGSAKPDVITTPAAEPKEARGGVIIDPPTPPGTIKVELSPGSFISADAAANQVMNAAAASIRENGARGVWL